MLEDPGDTEISNLDLPILGHEYVLCLEVSMKDLSVVDVLDCQGHLDEPVEDLVFSAAHFPLFFLHINFCVQVASVSVVHHNA